MYVTNSGYDDSGSRWDLWGQDSPEALAEDLDLIVAAGNMLPGGRIKDVG